MPSDYLNALVGGLLIGLSAFLLLYFNGRVLGVSGIVGGLLEKTSRREPWRYYFLAGLLLGGLLKYERVDGTFSYWVVVAGVLVGFGTRMGGGCTSGHGVCGISRLSKRSIVATGVFMFFGALTVFIVRHLA